jgi:hypothetical protein
MEEANIVSTYKPACFCIVYHKRTSSQVAEVAVLQVLIEFCPCFFDCRNANI